MASFEELKSRASSLLTTVHWVKQQLSVEPTAGAAAINSVISQAGRDLVVALGGGLSEYITGRRRYGTRAARSAINQGRLRAKQNLRDQKRQQAFALLDQTAGIVSELNDPIDWRVRRRLTLAISRARAAQRWNTIVDRLEAILQELVVYSPPDDDISVVRRLDAEFRRIIEGRLSALDRDWWHTRVPPTIVTRAEVEARRRAGGRLPALHFLSFADYGKIILLPANWEDSFGALFGNRDEFSTRLAQLRVLRNDVAHSRLLNASDRVRLRELASTILTHAAA